MKYHIRWLSEVCTKLDAVPFDTREEAEQVAAKIVRPGETYSVAEMSEKESNDFFCIAWKAKLLESERRFNWAMREGIQPKEWPEVDKDLSAKHNQLVEAVGD